MGRIDKKRNVLYLGSGKSVNLIGCLDLNDYTVVCANNSWRIFNEIDQIDVWVHSGDFPQEHYPIKNIFKQKVSHKEYKITAEKITNKLKIKTNSPQHYLGYTIFFLGIYWIIDTLKPEKISLLGFDHDYNKEKLIKWNGDNRPNIQNNFNNKKEKTIDEWTKNYFHNMKEDFFYGHGIPDPLRLGEKHLILKFRQLELICKKLNVELVNLSPVNSNINIIKKEIIL